MRAFLCALTFLPMPVLAETLTLPSRATEAVIYPQSGLVTHEVQFSVPAGRHQVMLPDLPPDLPLERLRVSAEGLTLGAIRYRTDFVPPRPSGDDEAIATAEARIEAIEDRMQQVQDRAARLTLAQAAAETRIEFLNRLGDQETLPTDPASLRDLAEMIGEEALAARESAFDAQVAAREVMTEMQDLKEELEEAQAVLRALVPQREDRPFLAIDVVADEPAEGISLRVSFFADTMSWQPAYDLRLSETETPMLTVARGAEVYQDTGENWEDVRLTLSTQRPGDQIEPSFLPEDLRRLFDPEEMRPMVRSELERGAMLSDEAAPAPAPAGKQALVAAPSFQGLSVVYAFPEPVDVASGADLVRIPFDELDFGADLVARAIPLRDDRAFLVARFTNDSTEPLLPANQARRYFDGGLVGAGSFPQIAAGEEAELGFGPIDGVQLTRTVLQRAEADRGLISRSNEETEVVRIEVENLTRRAWQLELLDRVPYSEQEDLDITYSADPEPDIRAVEDRRGILQWNTELPAGETFTVETEFRHGVARGQAGPLVFPT